MGVIDGVSFVCSLATFDFSVRGDDAVKGFTLQSAQVQIFHLDAFGKLFVHQYLKVE
jgi:hypothetical protein